MIAANSCASGIVRVGAIVVAIVPWAWSSYAVADDAETLAMRRVRLTTVPSAVQACARLGSVRDDSVKDLRRKVVRAGGDTAVLSFGSEDMDEIYAEVFRCASAGVPAAPGTPAAPGAPPAPGTSPRDSIPPPPPGIPPPAPAGPSR